jgi:DNA-directed RNA polymerase specialized sigma24 family protein
MLFTPNPIVRPVLVDKVSFQQFVKAQETAVYTFCFRLLGNACLAEQAAQTAFLDVCSRFPDISLADVLIAARRRCGEQSQCQDKGLRATTDNQYLFYNLTLPEREVLALYYGCQLCVADMATILNCSVGAVRANLLQARHHAMKENP